MACCRVIMGFSFVELPTSTPEAATDGKMGRMILRILGSQVRGGSAMMTSVSLQCVSASGRGTSASVSPKVYVHLWGGPSLRSVSSLFPSWLKLKVDRVTRASVLGFSFCEMKAMDRKWM